MQRLSSPTSSPLRRICRIGVATGVVGAAFFGTMVVANAQTTTSTPSTATARTPLTQAQLDAAKACMAAKGFTMPTRGSTPPTTIAGSPTTTKAPKTAEQRAAFETAATACGLPVGGPGGHGSPDGPGDRGGPGPDGHGRPGDRGGPGGPGDRRAHVALTDTQKACLTGKGITLPTPPAAGANTTGTRPARVVPTDAERAARDAAFAACGIVRPTPGAATTPTTLKAA